MIRVNSIIKICAEMANQIDEEFRDFYDGEYLLELQAPDGRQIQVVIPDYNSDRHESKASWGGPDPRSRLRASDEPIGLNLVCRGHYM